MSLILIILTLIIVYLIYELQQEESKTDTDITEPEDTTDPEPEPDPDPEPEPDPEDVTDPESNPVPEDVTDPIIEPYDPIIDPYDPIIDPSDPNTEPVDVTDPDPSDPNTEPVVPEPESAPNDKFVNGGMFIRVTDDVFVCTDPDIQYLAQLQYYVDSMDVFGAQYVMNKPVIVRDGPNENSCEYGFMYNKLGRLDMSGADWRLFNYDKDNGYWKVKDYTQYQNKSISLHEDYKDGSKQQNEIVRPTKEDPTLRWELS